MKEFQTSKWLSSKPHMIIISILLGFLLWAVVALSVNRTVTRTIDDVPVIVPESGTSFQALGLEVIQGETVKTSITVSGDRSVVGALDSSSFEVIPDFSTVTGEGTYSLVLQAGKSNQLSNYSIQSVTPAEITLTFAEIVSQRFAVVPDVEGATVAEGYILQNITSAPANINISGSQENMDKISEVVATATLEGELSASTTVDAQIHLLDANGVELSLDDYRIDNKEVELSLPVFMEGNLPLDVAFVGVPSGFDESILKYTLSPASIRVASSEEIIESLSSKTVGYIDLSTLGNTESFEFEISLSSRYINVDNVEKATVTFDSANLQSKRVTVTDLRLNSVPEGYDIKILSTEINGVVVMGDPQQVESLLPEGIVAVVDISTVNLQQGSFTVPVSFQIPSCDKAWVVGNYNVTLEVSKE